MGRGAERRPAVMLRSPLPGRRTSGVLARVGLGRGGVSLPRTRQNRKCRLHTQAQVSVCVPTREPGLSCVGTKRRQESETKIQKEIALGWALNIDAPQKGREEKAGGRRAARPGGLHHCGSCARKWAPKRGHHHGARAGPRFPRAFPERSGHGHRGSRLRLTNISSRSLAARAHLSPPTPPSFCMRVCARVCARLCARASVCECVSV